jgi:hypothetical protein
VTKLSHDFPRKPRVITGKSKVDAKLRSKKSKDQIKNSERLPEDTKASIHPNSSNPRGECYANAAHKNKDKKRQGKPKNDEVAGKAAPIGKDDVSMTSNITSLGALDSMSTVSTVTDDKFAQLCLDLHKKVNEPNALLAKFKQLVLSKLRLKPTMVRPRTMLSQALQLITSTICLSCHAGK